MPALFNAVVYALYGLLRRVYANVIKPYRIARGLRLPRHFKRALSGKRGFLRKAHAVGNKPALHVYCGLAALYKAAVLRGKLINVYHLSKVCALIPKRACKA